MSEEELWNFLSRGKVMALATIDEKGYPHNTPVWYVILDRTLYFRGGSDKKKIRNIKKNSKVSLTVEAGAKYTQQRGIMIQGEARRVTNGKLKNFVNRLLLSKYEELRNYEDMPSVWRRKFENEDREIIEIVAKKIVSWDNRKWVSK